MKLVVKDMDIATGGPRIVTLNYQDAKLYDLHHNDRILITFGNKKTMAIVDIGESSKAVPPGKIGMFEEVLYDLQVRGGNIVAIALAEKPESVRYIKQKLDGKQLTCHEICVIVQDIIEGRLSDIELTYYVAANYAFGMSDKEIVALTEAMIATGRKLPKLAKIVVDKHCIGGVPGNRTSLGVVPILAAAGLTVPKTSSRSITSPAGTADSMEVLANVSFGRTKLISLLKKTHACMVWGGAVDLAPADDTIINVEHPLSIDAEGQLLASIMAKKGSVGATHILIDIPVGPGTKVETMEHAQHLKKKFEELGHFLNMHVKIVVTNGREPIGNGIGPALEARDVMWILKNHPNQPLDLRRKIIQMAGMLLEMTGKAKPGQGNVVAEDLVHTGKAYEKMWEIIKAQGAKIKQLDDIRFGRYTWDYCAPKSGRVREIQNASVAKIARVAGCPQDKGAGLYLYKHCGDAVQKGEKIFTLYAQTKEKREYAKKMLAVFDGFVIR